MIYAFTGKKQSGKSTCCKHLETKFPCVRINFKDGLVAHLREHYKGMLNAIVDTMNKTDWNGMNPWTVERLFSEKPPLMRRLMQDVGEEKRQVDPYVWVNIWKESVKRYPDITILTDDVRHINEAEAVREFGGLIIRVERSDMHDDRDTHNSETQMNLIEPDYTLNVKTGEHQKLYSLLDYITEQWKVTTTAPEASPTSDLKNATQTSTSPTTDWLVRLMNLSRNTNGSKTTLTSSPEHEAVNS